MGGRVDAWLDRNQQRKDAYEEIQKEAEFTVNVYRYIGDTTTIGFTQEAPEPIKAKSINVRIDDAQQTNLEGDPKGQIAEADKTALTDSTDVLTGDMWKYFDLAGKPVWLRVVRVEPIESGTAVWLETLRKTLWPKAD